MELYSLRINGMDRPMGCYSEKILCSWKVKGATGQQQRDVKIKVAERGDFSNPVICVEGKELKSSGVRLDYEWKPRTRYDYRITVVSNKDEIAFAESFFEIGKMNEPWAALWIGIGEKDDFHPEFRKSFSMTESISQIYRARIYLTGLGLFEAFLNGSKVGNDYLAPFINDYKDGTQVLCYDITDYMRQDNEIQIILGKGWYKGKFGLMNTAHPERPYGLIAELHITYQNGEEQRICTDESWEYRKSFVEDSGIYDGEIQDWNQYQEITTWKEAQLIDAPTSLQERYSPELTAISKVSVREVIQTPAGETVLDFGQNFAGFVECKGRIPKGAVLKLEFGEILQNGNFFHENYRTAKSEFVYISDGQERLVRPLFTYFGFRYCKVTLSEGAVSGLDFCGMVLSSKMDRTGHFVSGNQLINRLHENTLWSLLSNFVDIPTDCPQRDERLGWCGDAQVFSRTAAYMMDTRAFYSKFLKYLRSDQMKNNGKVAVYLPNEFPGLHAAAWSDIGTILPMMLYETYGSTEQLEENYPLMKDWVNCIYTQDVERGEKNLWDFGFQFGDWLALDGATEQSRFGRTDIGYVASVYYYASTLYAAKAAQILGKNEAEELQQRADRIRAAIRREFFTESGRLAVETQTGYILALKFDLAEDTKRIADDLRNRIIKDCRKIKGGFVGATMMNTVLAENGLSDFAYDFLLYEGFPGWIYGIKHGATTIWERWNSVLENGAVSGTGMNSLNHYSYGAVCEFLYRDVAGIRMKEPGFSSVSFVPQPDIRLQEVHCSFDSIYGEYVSEWKIQDDGKLVFHFVVPFGCEAEICLPEQETIHVCAGTYDYEIQTEKDYRKPYSINTPFRELVRDRRAVEILDRLLPSLLLTLNRTDEEAMSKALVNQVIEKDLFRQPTDAIYNAVKEISELSYCSDLCRLNS